MHVTRIAVSSVAGLLLIRLRSRAAQSPSLDYFSVTPCRLLDTRMVAQGPALASGAPRLVTVAGSCGVPAHARAIAANIAAVAPTGGRKHQALPG